MRLQLVLIFLLLCFTKPLFSQSYPAEAKTIYTSAVYFDFGKHDLREEADTVLSAIKTFIADKESLRIIITAHTDSIGSLENNLGLSQRRSKSLKSALFEMGIPDSVMTIGNFGETKPSTSNESEIGRQVNRRATIEVIKYPPLTLLEGVVSDSKTGVGLYSMVVLHTKIWQDTLFTDSAGYFSKELPIGLVVGMDAYSKCYYFGNEMTKTGKRNLPVKIKLSPVQNGQTIDLDNLYFVGNKAILLPKSKPELPKILRFMQANPQMKIEVAGHINQPNRPNVAADSPNFILSVNRAKVVHDFLVTNGISTERVSYQGYGNWEMRFPHAVSEKQQALNRRVEMRIVEGGCE